MYYSQLSVSRMNVNMIRLLDSFHTNYWLLPYPLHGQAVASGVRLIDFSLTFWHEGHQYFWESPIHLASSLACLTLVPGAGSYPGSTVNAPDGSLALLSKSEYCTQEFCWFLLNLAIFSHYKYSIHLFFLLGWHHLLIHLCCFYVGACILHLTSFTIYQLFHS